MNILFLVHGVGMGAGGSAVIPAGRVCFTDGAISSPRFIGEMKAAEFTNGSIGSPSFGGDIDSPDFTDGEIHNPRFDGETETC